MRLPALLHADRRYTITHGSRYGGDGRQLWLPALLLMLAVIMVMITAGLVAQVIQGLLGVCCTFLLPVEPKKCCFKYSLFFFTKSANTEYPVVFLILAQDKLSHSRQHNSVTLLPDYVLFWFLKFFCLFAENCFLSLVYFIHPLY